MKGVVFIRDELVEIVDHVDYDTIVRYMTATGVDLTSYTRFMNGKGDYVVSADKSVDIYEMPEEDLLRTVRGEIKRKKKELYWLYQEEAELEDNEQE